MLPPNPKHWKNEHNGLDLREDLALKFDERLSVRAAFKLLKDVSVQPASDIPAARVELDHLLAPGSKVFSAMALPKPGGSGWLVLYNDRHPRTRVRASLMEEFFHIRLGHPPDVLRVYSSADGHRDYDRVTENEAYASAAAALVPYCSLCSSLKSGVAPSMIARQLEVSPSLVEYRIRVTRIRRRRK